MFTQEYINDYVKNSDVRWSGTQEDLKIFISTICINNPGLISPFDTQFMSLDAWYQNKLDTDRNLSEHLTSHYTWLRDYSTRHIEEQMSYIVHNNGRRFKVTHLVPHKGLVKLKDLDTSVIFYLPLKVVRKFKKHKL